MTLIKSRRMARPYRPPAPLGGRTAGGPPPSRRKPLERRRRVLRALTFLAPALIILAVFTVGPMLSALRLSFTDSNGFGVANWVGIANYAQIFSDPAILNSMLNTLLYAVLFTPVSVIVALALAVALNYPGLRLRGLFRSALFLPFIVSLAVAAFAWSYLLNPEIGLLSYWLDLIGVHLGNPIENPVLAMPTVVLIAVWKNFGFYMVIFLAGLQDVPPSLYEAAKVDGAGPWRRLTNVTIPMLSNTFGFVLVFALIAALQAFDQIYILTSGGPYGATQTVVYEIYEQGFQQLHLGFASALSYVLLAATLVLSLGQFFFFGRRESEMN
ncbi:MAG TPA: sugar ABC transporter permease [Galbitalea sp.]|nr:sugar ABC transporter permease [Galbitalea sp.]